ncbi:MAG: hypothetical protein CVU11_16590 [Bacteroidetes bacterium HGW-Bacteroidetes-6]|jgi:hypothetical protein|nr:MAG: hypothetical protein CVU11_16590 [Bacteroidetes bacterium HGW-Bacteroidetes-6]
MTFEGKLDKILNHLVAITENLSPVDRFNAACFSVEKFSMILNENLSFQEASSFQSRLLEDGYIELSEHELSFKVTNKAIVFVHKGGVFEGI